VLQQVGDGKLNVLFVGRCAPNKRIEDVLAAFYYLQRYHEPESRLIHVGSPPAWSATTPCCAPSAWS
jgi:glycosyltransferase involved in cell wall biosynthesis